jgi:hypothetical protein
MTGNFGLKLAEKPSAKAWWLSLGGSGDFKTIEPRVSGALPWCDCGLSLDCAPYGAPLGMTRRRSMRVLDAGIGGWLLAVFF